MQDTIGTDIFKDTLVAHHRSDGRHARFGNVRVGPTAQRAWVDKAPALVIHEVTGRCHCGMEGALDAAGRAMAKANPGRARRLAQAAAPRPTAPAPRYWRG